jgi:hypothetical protein
MKTLFTIFAFAYLSFTALAGQELDKFNQDIDTYLAAQAVNPKELLKYSDEKGDLARAVLDPDRLQKMIVAIFKEPVDDKKFKTTLDKYGSISKNYREVFETGKGNYDSEYLDVFEGIYHYTVTVNKQYAMLKTTKAEEAESLNGMLPIVAGALLSSFEKDINDGKFSQFYTPIARLRLSKLQSLAINLIK